MKKTANAAPTKAATKPVQAKAKSRRLTPEVRRVQILDAAAEMVVSQGFLPLPLEQLARRAGSSTALLYTYFPTQYALFNALLDRELKSLAMSGIDTASRINDLEQAAVLCAMLYFEHVARCGPLLHILFSDPYLTGRVDSAQLRFSDDVIERLTQLGKQVLPLSDAEVRAGLEMMTAIPQEAGSLVFHRQLDRETARHICHSLILSSIKALRSPDSVTLPQNDVA